MNLHQLFQQQLRIFGSFGCTLGNIKTVLDKMADKTIVPVIDTCISLDEIEIGLQRLEDRKVFGKIIVTL